MDRREIDTALEKETYIFNTPLEIGLRILFILDAIKPMSIDIDRLVIYDYFLIHSKDFPNGPDSIHPPIPHRAGQILIKPLLIKKALVLMRSKELIDICFSNDGITYKSNDLTTKFVELQENCYALRIKEVAQWLHNQFCSYSEKQLENFVKNNIADWGNEFIYESLIRE